MHEIENLERKIIDIEESLSLIEERLPENYEEFAQMDTLIKDGIFKRVEFIIERMFDVLFLICKSRRYIPEGDLDCVRYLEQTKVLPPELSEKLRLMKGFRNILVHRYGHINEELSFENMKAGLKDIHEFLKIAHRELLNSDKQ